MTEKTTAETLREARDLIADPERWTQKVIARDATGLKCDADSKAAVAWCAEGALEHVGADLLAREIRAIYRVADEWGFTETEEGESALADLNDSCTHAEVLAAFDRAIELAEAE